MNGSLVVGYALGLAVGATLASIGWWFYHRPPYGHRRHVTEVSGFLVADGIPLGTVSRVVCDYVPFPAPEKLEPRRPPNHGRYHQVPGQTPEEAAEWAARNLR